MPLSNLDRPAHETVMDVTEERIARVYAQAFMGVATKAPDPTALVEEIVSLVSDVLGRNPQLEAVLYSGLVAGEQKEQLLDRALKGRAAEPVLSFLKVLSRHGRLMLLPAIAQVLKELDATRRGVTDIEVRVASPIDDALRSEIQAELRKTLGGEPVLHVAVDPSLVAGMVIRIGDRVFDGSVHTQLEHARRAMIDRVTERIETAPDLFVVSAG